MSCVSYEGKNRSVVYNIHINYEDKNHFSYVKSMGERLSEDSPYLFLEDNFQDDELFISLNEKTILKEKVSCENSMGFG